MQGSGTRRWRIGKQEDHRFIPDQPLRILQNFVAQEEHVLESGDMLYLPPQWAHDGIAEASASGDCMTWSIDSARRLRKSWPINFEFFAGQFATRRSLPRPRLVTTKTPCRNWQSDD
ncbi:MAG: hypothetical protein IPP41_15655 [Rhodocyclaceae bacterium]|nr:hypothetical protein [Rhodocyclaceae bacterium]